VLNGFVVESVDFQTCGCDRLLKCNQTFEDLGSLEAESGLMRFGISLTQNLVPTKVK